jgi:hypothetical protein
VESSLWKRLWTCRKTNYWMSEQPPTCFGVSRVCLQGGANKNVIIILIVICRSQSTL